MVVLDPVTPGEMDGAGVPGLGDLRAGVLESTPLIRPRSRSCWAVQVGSSSQCQISCAECLLLSWKIALWVES